MLTLAFYTIITLFGVYGILQGITNFNLKRELRYMKLHLANSDAKIIQLDSDISLEKKRANMLRTHITRLEKRDYLCTELINNQEKIQGMQREIIHKKEIRNRSLLQKIVKKKPKKLPKAKKYRIKTLGFK